MTPVTAMLIMFSVLFPQKTWFLPDQPIMVTVKTDAAWDVVLTDFSGKVMDSTPWKDAPASNQPIDMKTKFPALSQPGTYVLYAVKAGQNVPSAPKDFLGTPLVIEVKQDTTGTAPPGVVVVKVEPLRYAVMTTDMGKLTCVFYYEAAPNTVDSFLSLSEGGFYDGSAFHRIVPDFVIQGGDPRWRDPKAAGTGGPGYSVNAEFNSHQHQPGVLSMARTSDPNSAGSQFFVCLDYAKTQQLDNQYTAFGKVVDGMDAVNKIAAVNVPDPSTGRPDNPPMIQKVEVLPVTADHNPYYGEIFGGK